MMMRTLHERMRSRLPRRDDDTGSLAFAMLLVLVGSALAALMVPMLLIQMNSTRTDVRRVQALDAAQAGIDVAIGHIRAANDGSGHGVLSSLPCGSFTGAVGVGNVSRYQVAITYFASDPRGQNAGWLTANAIACISGAGARSTPSYALLQALGTDKGSGAFSTVPVRSLQATYIFQTTNQNIAGGLIHVYKTTSTDLCIDAGSGSPAAGTQVTMQLCSSGSAQQKFAYNKSLNLVLVSTQTNAQPLGMCLDAGTPHAANAIVRLQPCTTAALIQQQWSFNDNGNFMGTTDGRGLDGYCFNVQTPNQPNSLIILSTNCYGGYDNVQNFQPDASVGAGAAGASSGQLVNFNEFGRCLDVPNFDVNAGEMIAWPCKQAPDPTLVGWNQRWTLPAAVGGATSATGAITANSGSALYCLTSPTTTAGNAWVSMSNATGQGCSSTTPLANMTWTVYTSTADYASSYRIMDSYGNCLQAADPTVANPDFFNAGLQVSNVIVAACSGSTLQKWNAPPNIQQPLPLKDIGEK
jgi:hypothetical protein